VHSVNFPVPTAARPSLLQTLAQSLTVAGLLRQMYWASTTPVVGLGVGEPVGAAVVGEPVGAAVVGGAVVGEPVGAAVVGEPVGAAVVGEGVGGLSQS